MAKDTPTCESVLMEAFKAQPQKWIKKVECYVIAEDWSPETVGRTLRDLAEDKTSGIEVEYYPAKHRKTKLAMYSLGKVVKPVSKWVETTDENGNRVMQLIS